MKACFAGHRNIIAEELPELKHRLEENIEVIIQEGVDIFLCGGAIGFDMLAGSTVLLFKKRYPHIKLILILPCREQDSVWSENYKADYRKLLVAADKVIYVSEKYYDGCMKKRNIHLVKNSEFCIAYHKHPKARGGAGQMMRFAKEKGMAILNLAY